MRENIENFIKDCEKIIEDKKNMDDHYSMGQIDTTKAVVMRLKLILNTNQQ